LDLEELRPLPRSFFCRDTVLVAKHLLGQLLVRVTSDLRLVAGRIVEVEAYKGLEDPASHAYRGNKGRARIMFGDVGYAYVYFTYGNHFCMNVVAKDPNTAAGAVLLRALEPVDGVDVMIRNRGTSDPLNLTSGPGKLTKALGITREFYGADLTKRGALFLAEGWVKPSESVCVSTRIGINVAADRPWRFFFCNNSFVSRRSIKK
jgi:DNA-3-methyladenine glycosylase